jgi:hypothetical protein
VTLRELLLHSYTWLVGCRLYLLAGAFVVPAVGTLAARIGKGGKTDTDGRFIANLVVGIGLVAVLLELFALFLAHSLFQHGFADADLVLLISPIICVAGCLLGIRWVFPLSELASVRSFIDVGAFVGACLGVLWLFSKFRGWGIVFFGSLPEMIAIGVLGVALLGRLLRRARGGRSANGTGA